jgi:predicted Zn-dependent peptidase
MRIEETWLSSEIRIVHVNIPKLQSAHLGVFVQTGSRNEPTHLAGISHFIEHMVFKGTQRRNSFHILNRLDSVGGDLNAYTSKEETVYHASFISKYYDRAMELLADLVLNPTFPDAEVEKEREVILEEFRTYKDMPSENIFDEFDEMLFPNEPFGKNILGSPKSLKLIHKKELADFHRQRYFALPLVICSVGKISLQRLAALVKKYFDNFKTVPDALSFPKPTLSAPFHHTISKKSVQQHIVLGCESFPSQHAKSITFNFINNILGGPAMNSRFNLGIREKYGLTYQLDSHYQAHSDIGFFTVYASTDKKTANRVVELIFKEIEKMKTIKMGVLQLSQAKNQYIGQMLLNREQGQNLMLAIGKAAMFKERLESFEEIIQKITQISASNILETANEIFKKDQFYQLHYQ